jgi:ABC-type sugar transport system ATPase subunit
LFDEPLSNLDAHLRNEMRVEIRRLHKKMKTTIIYVTHDQVEAMTLADRIAVLNGGYLQQVGSPLELFQRPDNKFVAGFIGSPAMNFINAEIKEENGKMRVIIDDANSIELDAEIAQRVENGQKVILGLRPQDVVLAEGDKSGDLTVTVDVVETLGWESHVHFKLGDLHFLAVLEADKVKNYKDGESVKLHVPMSAIHLFDVETEKAIAHGTKSDDEVKKAAKMDADDAKADDAKADDAKADATDEAKAEEPADKGE